MTDRMGREQIEALLLRIADHITSPRRFILFGGCAMTFHGAKGSTIDADAVIEPYTGYAQLIQDLKGADLDYNKNEAMDEYEKQDERETLESMEQWFGPSGRIDLFPAHAIWHNGLRFSPAMDARCSHWFNKDHLTVDVADLSTIFLLKAITGRWRNAQDRDIDDLRELLSRGLIDTDFIIKEWDEQAGNVGGRAVENAREAVAILRGEGLHLSWQP